MQHTALQSRGEDSHPYRTGTGPRRRLRLPPFWAVVAVALLTLGAFPALAHPDSPGSLPLLPHAVRLQHRRPAEILALLGSEDLPDVGARVPRSVRCEGAGSLLTGGVEAVFRTENPDELVVVATEGGAAIEECIRQLDVPVTPLGRGRAQVVVRLRLASPAAARGAVLRLPGAGAATLRDRTLALNGSRAWLHRALRVVIRAELGLPLQPPRRTESLRGGRTTPPADPQTHPVQPPLKG